MKPIIHIKISTVVIISVIVILLAGITYLIYCTREKKWSIVTIATATTGGTYYTLGKELADILDRDPSILSAVSTQTFGSIDNIMLLSSNKMENLIAFVQAPALRKHYKKNADTIRVLSRLYTDVIQIVVPTNAGINSIRELNGKTVFVGAEGSGNRLLADVIFQNIDYTPDNAKSYKEAAAKILSGKIDAALFAAGLPTESVKDLLSSGKCTFLNCTSNDIPRFSEIDLDFTVERIPPNLYKNQLEPVKTVGVDVLLVCHKELPGELAGVIIETMYDNIDELLFSHTIAQDIKLTKAFSVTNAFRLHDAARRFEEKGAGKLLIATGTINGKYWLLGKSIEGILENYCGIPAFTIQTDGSLENLELLATDRPVLAIVQYDTALAAYGGTPGVYNVDISDEIDIPVVEHIRRISTFHRERLHVFIRREALQKIENTLKERKRSIITNLVDLAHALHNLPPNTEKLRVCLGPLKSGTHVAALTILEHHGIQLSDIISSTLPVNDMITRIQDAEIDMGFFFSHVPSEAMKTVLNNPKIKLLSLGPKQLMKLTERAAFSIATISNDTYACQLKNEPKIQTITTRAILVTTKEPFFDVYGITKSLFNYVAFLNFQGDVEVMAEELTSLPLHTEARKYYEDAGYLPAQPPLATRIRHVFEMLTGTWRILAILVILTAAGNGILALRRNHTSDELIRRIIAVPLETNTRDALPRLLEIRKEIEECVRKNWWHWKELDKGRGFYLQNLLSGRISETQENLTKSFVAEIRNVRMNTAMKPDERIRKYQAIEHRVLDHFKNGELDSSRLKLIRELLAWNNTG